jgi:hypothetical protein
MVTETHPFGISPEFIEEWQRKQERVKIYNEPVRDMEKYPDVFDFLLEPVPEEDSIFTPEVVEVLREGY